MNGDRSIEPLVADAARAFAERHRDPLEEGERLRAMPTSVFEACEAMGWLGELGEEEESTGAEESARDQSPVPHGSRLLALVVHELSRVSPALGTRLLCHHFARQWARPFCRDDLGKHISEEGASAWLSVAPFATLTALSTPSASNVHRGGANDATIAMVLAEPVEAQLIVPLEISTNRVGLMRLSLASAARLTPVETLGLAGLGVADLRGWSTTPPVETVLSEHSDAIARSARDALRYVFPAYLALARAILRTAYDGARGHASIRRQGGGLLQTLPPVEERLSLLTASLATLTVLEGQGAFSHDEIDALLPQIRATLLKATDASLQTFGGAGYVVGTGQERHWRDARQVACLFGSRLGKLS